MKSTSMLCLRIVLLAVIASSSQLRAEVDFDPVSDDPKVFDPEYPATLRRPVILSGESQLNSVIYLAQGAGPHPTVLLLHGMPGAERNLDLAHAIRRAGWNVLVLHYRGTWGGEGVFSVSNALEDVASAFEFLSKPENVNAYRVDTDAIVLVGHSFGGFAGLMTAASNSKVKSVASLDAPNLGLRAREFRRDPEKVSSFLKYLDSIQTIVSGKPAEAVIQAFSDHADSWNLLYRAESLASKNALLIGASRSALQTEHASLVKAIGKVRDDHLVHMVLDTDHLFSDRRIELARVLISWLATQREKH